METAYHYLIPHSSNNHKAKTLHSKTIFIVILFLLLFQISISYILPQSGVSILGYASSIPVDEVIHLTNQKRGEFGLAPLAYNASLTQAAQAKGEDMLTKDYWAHVAPDGTEPWIFFINAGYDYRYAGENLARDFTNSVSTVDAWMSSPTHKDNLLSAKYSEIGVAVVEGDLNGVDTTIVVQLFGAKHADVVSENVADSSAAATQIAEIIPSPIPTQAPSGIISSPAPVSTPQVTPRQKTTPAPVFIEQPAVAAQSIDDSEVQILVSPFIATKTLSLVVTGFLLVILVVDAVVISRRRIARVSGRTFAHMAFIGMIIAVALILKVGRVI